MKKYAVIMASALIMFIPAVSNANYVPLKVKPPAATQSVDIKQGLQFFNAAYEAYFAAKNSDTSITAAENYVKAIANISKVFESLNPFSVPFLNSTNITYVPTINNTPVDTKTNTNKTK